MNISDWNIDKLKLSYILSILQCHRFSKKLQHILSKFSYAALGVIESWNIGIDRFNPLFNHPGTPKSNV